MRTIDKFRSVKIEVRDGSWFIHCGQRITPISIHRLIAIDPAESRVLDDYPYIPFKASYRYYWIVAHGDETYELYPASFSVPKISPSVRTLFVTLGQHPVKVQDSSLVKALSELARGLYVQRN